VQLWPDSRLDLVLLLALLQVAWWPPESVGKGLDASLVFDQQPGLRRLWSNGKLVLEVGYTGEYAMHIVLPARPAACCLRTTGCPPGRPA
jgi:hypothetical protein